MDQSHPTPSEPIKHEFYKDKDGKRDDFIVEYDGHNGPQCMRCSWAFCVYCHPEDLDDVCFEQTEALFAV